MQTRTRLMCMHKLGNLCTAELKKQQAASGESKHSADLALVAELLDTGASDESEVVWARVRTSL